MYTKQDKLIFNNWKINFFDYFLGQQKQKQFVLLVQENMSNREKDAFLNLFLETDHIQMTFRSSTELQNYFYTSTKHLFVLLINENLVIENIQNDQRLFIFQSLSNQYKFYVTNSCEQITFNKIIDTFYLSTCYLQYLHLTEKIYLDISNIHGFGMFAREELYSGEILFKLTGEVYTQEFFKDKNFHGEWNALENGKFLVRKNRTSYGFINHSKNPNCYITKDMHIKILKNIQCGEEIFLDYRKESLPEDYVKGFGKTYL